MDLNKALILGIESSCDDTAASVLEINSKGSEIKSSIVHNQFNLHKEYGGVVPEIAARAHAELIDVVVAKALKSAKVAMADISAIGVTAGPGLIGGVLSGLMFAKGLSVSTNKPLIGVNHLAGHALTPRLTNKVAFPYLVLLVSGGHCQFLIVHSYKKYERLGGTIDDAPGEAFDKAARLLGLQQPGGPAIEEAAIKGDVNRFDLPRPLLDREDCNFSFSGLKTALMRKRNELTEKQGGLFKKDICDLSASFQQAMHDVIIEKSIRAIDLYSKFTKENQAFAIAGGVAANKKIRRSLKKVCETKKVEFLAPPLELCTDNAAIIAYAAAERFFHDDYDDTTISARPRWPLDNQKPAILGSGKKGSKA
jgi:N6-L-threonylcarbamoyladenine synthase